MLDQIFIQMVQIQVAKKLLCYVNQQEQWRFLIQKKKNKTFGLLKKNSDWCPSSHKDQIPRKIETGDDQIAQARDQEEWCEAETKSCRRKKRYFAKTRRRRRMKVIEKNLKNRNYCQQGKLVIVRFEAILMLKIQDSRSQGAPRPRRKSRFDEVKKFWKVLKKKRQI